MHAAHRCAEDQAQMVYGEALAEKLVVSGNHVVIVVLREVSMQPVAWLRRFPVTNAVGKNDVVAIRIEKLPGSEELPGKLRLEELLSRAAGAVENQDGVCDAALRVAHRLAKRHVVQSQFRQRLARPEFEILDDEIAFGCCGKRRLLACGRRGSQDSDRAQQDEIADYGRHPEHLVGEKFNTPGEPGEMQSQRAWKFFLQYPLRISSADFVGVTPTNWCVPRKK